MKREEIENLLTNVAEEERKAIIDKIMELNGKDVNSSKGRVSELETQIASLREQNESANSQIEKFKELKPEEMQKSIDDYKTQLEKQKADFELKLTDVKRDNAIENGLLKAGAKNIKATRALIDANLVGFDKEGNPIGLEEQIKSIKESEETAFLFSQQQPNIPQKAGLPPSAGDPVESEADTFAKWRNL